jgi:hypothetical protein
MSSPVAGVHETDLEVFDALSRVRGRHRGTGSGEHSPHRPTHTGRRLVTFRPAPEIAHKDLSDTEPAK